MLPVTQVLRRKCSVPWTFAVQSTQHVLRCATGHSLAALNDRSIKTSAAPAQQHEQQLNSELLAKLRLYTRRLAAGLIPDNVRARQDALGLANARPCILMLDMR